MKGLLLIILILPILLMTSVMTNSVDTRIQAVDDYGPNVGEKFWHFSAAAYCAKDIV